MKLRQIIVSTIIVGTLIVIIGKIASMVTVQGLGGGTGTINTLDQWTSTSTPFSAITPRTNGKNIYLPFSTATTSRSYATTFCINNASPDCITAWSSAGGEFPFTPVSYGNATSTTLGFLNGFLSTASSTFTSNVNLATISGNVGIGTTNPQKKLDIDAGDIRFSSVLAPTGTPIIALGAAGVLTGSYSYRVSYVTATSETEVGSLSSTISPVSQQINLTSIPVSSDGNVIARNIYRNKTADGVFRAMYLVTTINNNTTTTYTDNIADASLGAVNLNIQTTGGVFFVNTTPLFVANSSETAIGLNALSVNTAPANSAFGFNTLKSNTTGGFNNAFGLNSMQSNVSGNSNNAFGNGTLFANVSGGSNSAFGNNTLAQTTVGSNSAFGSGAGQRISTGSNNVAIGDTSLNNTQTGFFNTAVGSNAGKGVASNSFTSNSLFGYLNGQALTTGSRNTFFGTFVASTTATGANNIAIGYDIALPSINGSNQLNIGNLIFGTGINGEGTVLSSGNIGISTTSPAYKLTAIGTFAVATTTNNGLPNFSIDSKGHLVTSGVIPTVSSCGTSPAIYGNDTNWRVLAGSVLATSCTITFSKTFTTAPVCTITQETGTAVAVVASSTPTNVVISGATFTSDWFVGRCEKYE